LKIAILFDNQRRPDTTGVYCYRALQKEHEVTHFLPGQLEHLRPGAYDVYLQIDDGFSHVLPPHLHPSIFWAIDTHVNFERCLEKAKHFDLVFCAQRSGAEKMRRRGIPARWCPLAFDPEIHRKWAKAKILDISFVGNFGHFRWGRFFWKGKKIFKERARLISLLKKKFHLFTGNFFFEDMALVYSISKIVFNRSVADDVNMRVFEALGCGSLLVTNRIGPGQDLLFKHKKHLIEYRTPKDLIEAVDYYLHHDAEREEIAAQGQQEALRKHTYAHRMDYMLSFLKPWTPQRFGEREISVEGDPWVIEQKVLQSCCHGRGIDVGCGPRKIQASAIGIDIQKKGTQAEIISAGDNLPFRDGMLDYVVACHNLEHYEDPQRALAEWRRVLKPGGVLGAVVPDDRIIDTRSLNPEHRQAFTPDRIRQEIVRNGGWSLEVMEEVIDGWSFGFLLRKVEG
jgi:hypothetical protein